jgi:rhodanese-related sulfurtransferase
MIALFLIPNLGLEVEGKAISAEELHNLIKSGKDVLIVDASSEEDYKGTHIPGAKHFEFPKKSISSWNIRETYGKTQEDFVRLLGPDKNKTIVFYCTGRYPCPRSGYAAEWARKSGYNNVYDLGNISVGTYVKAGSKDSTD